MRYPSCSNRQAVHHLPLNRTQAMEMLLSSPAQWRGFSLPRHQAVQAGQEAARRSTGVERTRNDGSERTRQCHVPCR